MTPRARLTLDPLPAATFGTGQAEYEVFLFGKDVDAVPFAHWTAHLRSFWGLYAEEPDYLASDAEFPDLRARIADGLHRSGFVAQSEAVSCAKDQHALNDLIVRQYTEETDLYPSANATLRRSHEGELLTDHPLTPWVLQLNCAMRRLSIHDDWSFRGSLMSPADVRQYTERKMFEWHSFISASRDRHVARALGGNVLFEIKPGGSHSMHAKRNPYDIAHLSIFPEEAEVIFPSACTFRVLQVHADASFTRIILETVDWY